MRQDVVEAYVDTSREETFKEPSLVQSASPQGGVGYLQLFWRKRRILFRTTVGALIISVVLVLLIPKRYESTVTIMPPNSLDSSGMMMALAGKSSPELAGMAANLLGIKSTGDLFIGLLRSRTVEDQIVDKFNLQKIYGTGYKQDARKVLDDRTKIDEDRKSGILTVTVQDRTPQRAHDIAESYVEELNNLLSQVSTSSARRERVFIEQRLVTVKSDLENDEHQFSDFASKNTALDIKEQTRALVDSAATLQGQLIAAQSELEGLLQIYSPNNVRVRSVQARVDELKRQLRKIGGTDDTSLESTTTGNDMYPSIRKLPLLGVQWSDLYRRMKIQETVYELLSQQYELARIQEAKEIPTVNIIDPANIPEKKSFPPRIAIVLLMALFSLFCTMAWVIGLEHWKNEDTQNPYKQLIEQILHSLANNLRKLREHPSLNGFRKPE